MEKSRLLEISPLRLPAAGRVEMDNGGRLPAEGPARLPKAGFFNRLMVLFVHSALERYKSHLLLLNMRFDSCVFHRL